MRIRLVAALAFGLMTACGSDSSDSSSTTTNDDPIATPDKTEVKIKIVGDGAHLKGKGNDGADHDKAEPEPRACERPGREVENGEVVTAWARSRAGWRHG